jgi:hypothetical protein
MQNNRKGTRIPKHISSSQMAPVWKRQRFPFDASPRPNEKAGAIPILCKLKNK